MYSPLGSMSDVKYDVISNMNIQLSHFTTSYHTMVSKIPHLAFTEINGIFGIDSKGL